MIAKAVAAVDERIKEKARARALAEQMKILEQ